jgi:hypothetical protein
VIQGEQENDVSQRAQNPPQMTAKPLSRGMVVLAAILILNSCAGFSRTKRIEEIRPTITYITRTLTNRSSYAYVETKQHTAMVSDDTLADFFARHPRLNGRLTRSDYLFLLDLSQDAELRSLLDLNPHGQLARQIKGKLELVPHVQSEASRRGAYSESAKQIDSLNPVDRIKITLLLQSLSFADFRSQLARHLVADILDTSSEYGGAVVLSAQPGCPLSLQQIPSLRSGDYEYVPSPELLNSGCVVIWHNHAASAVPNNILDVDNSSRAGPSGTLRGSLVQVGGDMWQCYIQGIDAVIVTPVGGGNFNLDFVNSEGIVLDLGVYPYGELN